MSLNLFDQIKSAVSKEALSGLGGLIGQQDESTVSSMFDVSVQSILAGIVKKVASGGASQIFEAVMADGNESFENISGHIGQGNTGVIESMGGKFIDLIFGSSQSGMFDKISKLLNVDSSTIGKLLKYVAPLVLSFLTKTSKGSGLDVSGFQNLISDQSGFLSSSMSSGLSEAIGFGSDADQATATSAGSESKSGNNTLLYVILLLAALALGYAFFSGGFSADTPNIPNKGFDGAQ